VLSVRGLCLSWSSLPRMLVGYSPSDILRERQSLFRNFRRDFPRGKFPTVRHSSFPSSRYARFGVSSVATLAMSGDPHQTTDTLDTASLASKGPQARAGARSRPSRFRCPLVEIARQRRAYALALKPPWQSYFHHNIRSFKAFPGLHHAARGHRGPSMPGVRDRFETSRRSRKARFEGLIATRTRHAGD